MCEIVSEVVVYKKKQTKKKPVLAGYMLMRYLPNILQRKDRTVAILKKGREVEVI